MVARLLLGSKLSNYNCILPKVCLKSCRKVAHLVPKGWTLIIQTIPRSGPNLGRTLPKPCQNLARTLPEPCQNLARTLPEPCQNLARTGKEDEKQADIRRLGRQ